MRIIGITGQSGSGKGTLCRALAAYGYIHLDTDAIYHDLLDTNATLVDELIRAFGKDIAPDGNVDRKILSAKVFGDKNRRRLKALNKITHRYVCRAVIERIYTAKAKNAVGVLIDAPLLFEARLNFICDTVVLVCCDPATRIRRVVERDGIPTEAATMRIRAQGDPLKYAAHCDYLFVNDGDGQNITEAAKEIHSMEI